MSWSWFSSDTGFTGINFDRAPVLDVIVKNVSANSIKMLIKFIDGS